MTYRELERRLQEIPEDHMDDDATVLLMGPEQVIPVMDFVTSWDGPFFREKEAYGIDKVDGVLDDGHPYFTVAY